MIICYLSHVNNYHTIKWANYFATKGNRVHVLSLEKPDDTALYNKSVKLHWLETKGSRTSSDLNKLQYFTAVSTCRELLESLNPDIVHAHYATSYGLLCAFSWRRKYFLSVWGSDVFEFPRKSKFHEIALRYSLSRCTYLLSTSNAMAQEVSRYTSKKVFITPFGVDVDLFKPRKPDNSGKMVIGTVKALEAKYGIDILLKACALLRKIKPNLDFEVRIAGKGSQEGELKKLTTRLRLDDRVVWLGFLPQERVAEEWSGFDVAVVCSSEESFGVSAVEAQACGTPLIISDIPGLKEACCNGETALVVKPRDPESLASGIYQLISNTALRNELAAKGREYACANYEVGKCFSLVEGLYQKALINEGPC